MKSDIEKYQDLLRLEPFASDNGDDISKKCKEMTSTNFKIFLGVVLAFSLFILVLMILVIWR